MIERECRVRGASVLQLCRPELYSLVLRMYTRYTYGIHQCLGYWIRPGKPNKSRASIARLINSIIIGALERSSHHSETVEISFQIGRSVKSTGNGAIAGVVIEAATPHHTEDPGVGAMRILRSLTGVLIVIKVPAKLPDITTHVIYPQFIGVFGAHCFRC